jgi:hypothetical protein
LVEIPKKELFILDGIIEQIELLKKICPKKIPETPKDKHRSKINKEAKDHQKSEVPKIQSIQKIRAIQMAPKSVLDYLLRQIH